MIEWVMKSNWCDKSKYCAITTIGQYAEFLGLPVPKSNFRVYDNTEMYVPDPEMVKQFVYRIRSKHLRAMVLVAIETAASVSEVWNLKWADANLASKTIKITGVKGHRTRDYPISDELTTLLMQLPKDSSRIFSNIGKALKANDCIIDYRQRIAKETGNSDFLKIHFHTFRHFAISWHYFKTKDIVDTQRFARHCNINNTLKYVHIVKSWIKENEYEVVYAEDKSELTKCLSEGYSLVTKTDWGYCLTKPKTIGG
jgi:integrase